MIKLLCYYTNDSIYKKHFLALEQSAKKFNLELISYSYHKDDWLKITALKPCIINKEINKTNGKILYIDSDALILDNILDYFQSVTEDIAVHYLHDTELLSGTLFFNNTKGAKLILNEWENEQKKTPNEWDQKVLQEVLKRLKEKNKISIKKISESYTHIFDIDIDIGSKPIIEHYQASRDIKWINKYNSSNFIKKIIMNTYFKSITRKIKKRHQFFNQRCDKLGINIKFNMSDLRKYKK